MTNKDVVNFDYVSRMKNELDQYASSALVLIIASYGRATKRAAMKNALEKPVYDAIEAMVSAYEKYEASFEEWTNTKEI